MVKLPSPNWSLPLTRPVHLRDGTHFATIGEVRAFILDRLPPRFQEYEIWHHVAGELLAAAASGDTREATLAVKMALTLEGALGRPTIVKARSARAAI